MQNMDEAARPEDEEFVFVAVQLFNRLPDAVVVIDETGMIKYVNDESELLFGYHRSELHGQSIEMLVPDHLKEAHAGHRTHFNNEPRRRAMGSGLNLSAKRKNGGLVEVEINLSPLSTPWGMRHIAAIRRKTASEQMRS